MKDIPAGTFPEFQRQGLGSSCPHLQYADDSNNKWYLPHGAIMRVKWVNGHELLAAVPGM